MPDRNFDEMLRTPPLRPEPLLTKSERAALDVERSDARRRTARRATVTTLALMLAFVLGSGSTAVASLIAASNRPPLPICTTTP